MANRDFTEAISHAARYAHFPNCHADAAMGAATRFQRSLQLLLVRALHVHRSSLPLSHVTQPAAACRHRVNVSLLGGLRLRHGPGPVDTYWILRRDSAEQSTPRRVGLCVRDMHRQPVCRVPAPPARVSDRDIGTNGGQSECGI